MFQMWKTFYDSLTGVLRSVNIVILMGDFSTQLVSDNSGRQRIGQMPENWKLLEPIFI